MRMSRFRLAALALALAPVFAVHAQSGGIRYRWHDEKGLAHYSDSLTADAIKFGYDMVNDRGIAVGHVQRHLSPEERAAAARVAAAEAARQKAEDEQHRADMRLLNSYGDEASLQREQQAELDNIDQQITTTQLNLRSQEKTLADLLDRAADLERSKQTVPSSLVDSIARQRDVVAGQRRAIERQQADREANKAKAKVVLEHYRELKQARQPGQG